MKQFITRCSCGSEQEAAARYDAKSIFLCYACEKCWPEKKKKYRPEVHTNPDYWTDEEVDPS